MDLRQGPSELTCGQLKSKGPDKSEDCLDPCHRVNISPNVQNTNQAQLDSHKKHSNDIDGSASKAWHEEEPIDQASHKSECVATPS